MDDPKLQMARRACATACDDPAWRPEIIAGKCDHWLGVRSALAAIEETTELCAQLGDERAAAYVGHNMVEFGEAHEEYAAALRNGDQFDHLKGPPA